MEALPSATPLRIDAAAQALSFALTFAQPADQVLQQLFRSRRELGQQDRAFTAEIMFAVLRRMRTLTLRAEATIAAACARAAKALDAAQVEAAPASTPVPAAVPTPRQLVLIALVHLYGVSARALEPAIGRNDAQWLSYSHDPLARKLTPAEALDVPDWLYDRLVAQKGEQETRRLIEALNQPAPLDLRVNTLKTDRDTAMKQLHARGLDAQPTPWSPLGLRLHGRPVLAREPLFIDGAIEVQDEGSQLLALLVAPKRREMVVDFCAGAGGKTLALGALMQSTGRLYAFDVSEKRLKAFEPRLKKSGLSNVQPQLLAHEHDAKVKRLAGKIDRVLVDAPCTGLGTLRRNPDMKWRQTEAAIAQMTQKQTSILASASRLVKPGGRLVYATCSLLAEENRRIVDAFLETHGEFALRPASELLHAQGIELAGGDCLELAPHRHATDGFFAAVLERRSA